MSDNRELPKEWHLRAEALYQASLYLFPSDFRNVFGRQMIQGFRDRCREVEAGQLSRLDLYSEMFLDTGRSVIREHFDEQFGTFPPRRILLAWLFAAGVGLLLIQNPIGRAVGYGYDAISKGWEQHEMVEDVVSGNARRAEMADRLIAEGSDRSLALASILYQSNAAIRRDVPAAPEPARSELDINASIFKKMLARSPTAYELALATRGCDLLSGCDLLPIAERFVSEDPENAYAWATLWWAGERHGDTPLQRRALGMMAGATRYEDYEGQITADLLRAAPPENITESYRAILLAISYLPAWPRVPLACGRDPMPDSAVADCGKATAKLAASTTLNNALRGWTYIAANATSLDARVLARQKATRIQKLREASAEWPQAHFASTFRDKSGQDIEAWVRSFKHGDGEIASTERWLAGLGHMPQISRGAANAVAAQ